MRELFIIPTSWLKFAVSAEIIQLANGFVQTSKLQDYKTFC